LEDLPDSHVKQEGGSAMPKTPAQARFDKLKKIGAQSANEQRAKHDHQQKLKDGKADLLAPVEPTKPTDK